MQKPEFIQKLIRRDEQAFRQLVEEHQHRIYNTCLGFLRNVDDAKDIAQEVFMQAYQSIESFRGDAALGTWLYRIAVTKCLEEVRRRKREKRSGFFQALSNTAEPDTFADTNRQTHPGIALENKERATILMDAIATLPEPQRVAFTLHKIEGLAYKDVAIVMETTLGAVESLMHRAKQNLQNELYTYYKNEGI